MKYTIRATTLPRTTLQSLLRKFEPATQSFRILEYLGSKKKVPTGELAATTSCGNISQIVRTVCNPKLLPEGFQIRCEKPLDKIKNQFDQDTQQHHWSLCKVLVKPEGEARR